jgi:hypothetical protein
MRPHGAEIKKIAAVAAALSFIESETSGAPAATAPGKGASGSRSKTSPWALYGRQQIMNMRGLLQRRAIRR